MGKRKVIRVVLDTNVVVSALLFGGPIGKIISQWKKCTIQPLFCQSIIEEYLRVLAYPKFGLTKQEIDFLFFQEILPFFEVVHIQTENLPVIIKDDPSDDIFLHCAKAGHAAFIVSGDRHLLSLNFYEDIKIMQAGNFLSTVLLV